MYVYEYRIRANGRDAFAHRIPLAKVPCCSRRQWCHFSLGGLVHVIPFALYEPHQLLPLAECMQTPDDDLGDTQCAINDKIDNGDFVVSMTVLQITIYIPQLAHRIFQIHDRVVVIVWKFGFLFVHLQCLLPSLQLLVP